MLFYCKPFFYTWAYLWSQFESFYGCFYAFVIDDRIKVAPPSFSLRLIFHGFSSASSALRSDCDVSLKGDHTAALHWVSWDKYVFQESICIYFDREGTVETHWKLVGCLVGMTLKIFWCVWLYQQAFKVVPTRQPTSFQMHL